MAFDRYPNCKLGRNITIIGIILISLRLSLNDFKPIYLTKERPGTICLEHMLEPRISQENKIAKYCKSLPILKSTSI